MGRPWLEAAAALDVWLWRALRGLHEQPKLGNALWKQSLVCWCRWGSCWLALSPSCLVRARAEGNGSLSGVKGGIGLPRVMPAASVLLISSVVQERPSLMWSSYMGKTGPEAVLMGGSEQS